MAKKGHFKGSSKCLIHTSRDGSCQHAPCNYKNNTPAASGAFADATPRNSHHILCCSSTIKYQGIYKGPIRAQIDKVYNGTDWCVNNKDNLIWLPLKGTYKKKARKGVKFPGPIWDTNLPCHDWGDHNCLGGFTDEVTRAFKARIWGRIKRAAEKKKCFEPDKAVAAIESLQGSFRRKLASRGKRQGGTRAGILAEGSGKWWFPFSMANNAIALSRPVRKFGRKPDTPAQWARWK